MNRLLIKNRQKNFRWQKNIFVESIKPLSYNTYVRNIYLVSKNKKHRFGFVLSNINDYFNEVSLNKPWRCHGYFEKIEVK